MPKRKLIDIAMRLVRQQEIIENLTERLKAEEKEVRRLALQTLTDEDIALLVKASKQVADWARQSAYEDYPEYLAFSKDLNEVASKLETWTVRGVRDER